MRDLPKTFIRIDKSTLKDLQRPLLFPSSPLPEPAGFEEARKRPCANSATAAEALTEGIATHGIGFAHVTDPLDIEGFIALGCKFGTPLPESDPSIAPFVHESVVLSLQDDQRSEADQLTPFTPRPLTLHTEGSRRPTDQQPRFIILMCVDPGSAGDASQTVLVPIPAILAQLSEREIRTLSGMRETIAPGSPPLIRWTDKGPQLSFRDLGETCYELESAASEQTTERALSALVRACYLARPVNGTRWRRGDIVAIDNQRWMHGRTGATVNGERPRHLQRMRIVAS